VGPKIQNAKNREVLKKRSFLTFAGIPVPEKSISNSFPREKLNVLESMKSVVSLNKSKLLKHKKCFLLMM